MDLQRILSGKWFARLVLVVWLICAVSLVVILKNMEHIVHVQLYEYGLELSPDWLNPYTLYSSLIYYLCLGLPLILTGFALIFSFFNVEEVAAKNVVPQSLKSPQVARVGVQPVVREVPKSVESGNGISCPHCKKVFSRALVMLDFRGGKNQLVSVCPYCNHILGVTRDEKGVDENVYVVPSDEKIIR